MSMMSRITRAVFRAPTAISASALAGGVKTQPAAWVMLQELGWDQMVGPFTLS